MPIYRQRVRLPPLGPQGISPHLSTEPLSSRRRGVGTVDRTGRSVDRAISGPLNAITAVVSRYGHAGWQVFILLTAPRGFLGTATAVTSGRCKDPGTVQAVTATKPVSQSGARGAESERGSSRQFQKPLRDYTGVIRDYVPWLIRPQIIQGQRGARGACSSPRPRNAGGGFDGQYSSAASYRLAAAEDLLATPP